MHVPSVITKPRDRNFSISVVLNQTQDYSFYLGDAFEFTEATKHYMRKFRSFVTFNELKLSIRSVNALYTISYTRIV